MSASANYRAVEATHALEIRTVFDNLAKDETKDGILYRTYAHHLARACWHGGRIMLRQTSPEAEGIFDFILELHRGCSGRWNDFRDRGVTQDDLDAWLEFVGMFLSSLGNHFDDGDRKVIPNVSTDALSMMASISSEASAKLQAILEMMMAPQPAHLGFPGDTSQSSYYPGNQRITKHEIEAITNIMEARKIAPENTRLRKNANRNASASQDFDVFEILQASAEKDIIPRHLEDIKIGGQRQAKVFLCRGDHSEEMAKICVELTEAIKHAATDTEKLALSQLTESFRTGDYEAFHSAQKTWVKDKAPRIEHCMGFLFGYRDPYGMRAEWQASAGIADAEETSKMSKLVEKSPELICTLPWAVPGENGGKGPFEPSELDVPDFAVIHVLASVSSTVWEATNITVDDKNGERHGVKSMVYGNRLSLNNNRDRPCYYIHPAEVESFSRAADVCRFIGTAIHELIGHGTGKLLTEIAPGKFNFDHKHPPISPVTGKPIQTWYMPGQTWVSVFGKLAPTVEECRAFLIANYLADNKDILALFGYNQESTPTADELIYFTYLQIGVSGLRALSSFKVEDQAWGGDHDQAQFAILKHIIQDGGGVLWIEQDPVGKTLYIHVDRSKIESHGKPSLGRMLCKIHVWHSTADINACRPYYDNLSAVDGEYETWRQIVVSNAEPKWKFVQPNTFLREDGTIEVKEYEASNVGIIQSFFERDI